MWKMTMTLIRIRATLMINKVHTTTDTSDSDHAYESSDTDNASRLVLKLTLKQ